MCAHTPIRTKSEVLEQICKEWKQKQNKTKATSSLGREKKVSPAPFLINYSVYQSLNSVIDDARANKLIYKIYYTRFNEIYVDSTLF